jgi:beta-mannosidase
MAADLNCNMIRCWGGNVYEDDEFFTGCDELGIMVWQDFAFACASYPQDDDFAACVTEEAVSVIKASRNHPSLVLWAGDNEVDALHGWNAGFEAVDPNMNRLSRRVLASAVYEHDPSRPYLPSSPYVSPATFALGKGQHCAPEQHLWGPRGYYKDPFYTETNASFVSEIGYHGCPSRTTLEQMFDADHLYPWIDPADSSGSWNPQWQAKAVVALPNATRQRQRNNLMRNQIKHLFGTVPDDLDEFIQASQIVQAEALKFFIEFFRTGKWRRTGIIWWNLRDGWPILSDAVTDYYFRKKLAYSFIQRVQQDAVTAITDATEGRWPVTLVNDSRKIVNAAIVIREADSGRIAGEYDATAQPGENVVVGALESDEDDQGVWIIHTTFDNGSVAVNHYLRGCPPFSLQGYRKWIHKAGVEI